LVVVVTFPKVRFSLFLLGKDTPCGDFTDVGWGEVHTVPKPVLEFGQFDSFGVNGRHDFVELLLRGDDDPTGSRYLAFLEELLADLPEMLHGRPKILDLITAASHMLANFIDDEDQRFARPTTAHQLEGALNDSADRDRSLTIPVCVGP